MTVIAPSLVKLAQSTSLTDTGMAFYHPADFDLAIGETVTYELTIVLPEGVTSTSVITDYLPSNATGVIEAVGASISSLGGNITTSLPGTPQFFDSNLGDGLDDTVVFNFGTITNSPDGVSNSADRIIVLVVGRVVDVSANMDSDWLSNTGVFTFASGPPLADSAEIDVVEPVMAVTKNMGPVTNGLVTLNVQLTNNGTAPAYDIVLEDVLNDSLWNTATISPIVVPTGYTFTSAPGPGPGDVTITMASDPGSSPPGNSVEPGEIIAFQFQAALADPANPPASVPNTATNTQTTSLPGPDSNQRELPPTSGSDILDLPILDAFKSASLIADNDGSGTVSPGDVIRYTITVNNTGNGDATQVSVNDFPDGNGIFMVGSVTATPPGVVLTGNTAGDITVEAIFTTVSAGGSATVTYDVAIPNPLASGITQLVNQALIDSDQLPGFPSDDPSTPSPDDPTVVPIDAAPDIAVTKTNGVSSVVPGETLTYTITIQNTGNQDAVNVTLSDVIPPGTGFVSASDGGAETPPGGGIVVWPLFNLPAGASVTRTLVVDVIIPPPPGLTMIVNTATAADDGSNGPDPNPGNNTGTDIDPLIYADVAVTKTDSPDPVIAGETLIWTLTVTNLGVSDATGVVLDDTLPAGVTLNSTSTPCAAGFPCTIGNLAVGASVVVSIDVTVDPDVVDNLTNTASVTANEVDPDPTNNTATEPTTVGQSTDLAITKTDSPDPVVAGEALTWTIEATNNGPSDATGVVLEDVIPMGVTVNSISAPCAGGFPCMIGNLTTGSTVTVTVDVTVDSDSSGLFPTRPRLPETNPTPIQTTTRSPNPPRSSPWPIWPSPRPVPEALLAAPIWSSPSWLKTSVLPTPRPAITDPTPAGLSFVSASVPCDGPSVFPCTVPCAGFRRELQFRCHLCGARPATPNPTRSSTPASVSSDIQDPDPTNNTSSSSTAVDRPPEADLEILKSGPQSAAPGSTVTYQLVVINHGPDDAADVTIDDRHPRAWLCFGHGHPAVSASRAPSAPSIPARGQR